MVARLYFIKLKFKRTPHNLKRKNCSSEVEIYALILML